MEKERKLVFIQALLRFNHNPCARRYNREGEEEGVAVVKGEYREKKGREVAVKELRERL